MLVLSCRLVFNKTTLSNWQWYMHIYIIYIYMYVCITNGIAFDAKSIFLALVFFASNSRVCFFESSIQKLNLNKIDCFVNKILFVLQNRLSEGSPHELCQRFSMHCSTCLLWLRWITPRCLPHEIFSRWIVTYQWGHDIINHWII